jgi:hypothetical protein
MTNNNILLIIIIAIIIFIVFNHCDKTEKFTPIETMQNPTNYSTVEPTQNQNNSQSVLDTNIVNNDEKQPITYNANLDTPVNNFVPNQNKFDYGTTITDAFKDNYNDEYKNINNDGTQIRYVDINKENKQNYNVKDFLPMEVNDEWFDTDFSQAKHNIKDGKLINTDRYIIGINTVGQSLKNASYDIRTNIPNPKISVSPWNNSTYEPDNNIKSLC